MNIIIGRIALMIPTFNIFLKTNLRLAPVAKYYILLNI